MVSAVLYFFTGSERFKASKMFKFVNSMVTQRFLALLKQVKKKNKNNKIFNHFFRIKICKIY